MDYLKEAISAFIPTTGIIDKDISYLVRECLHRFKDESIIPVTEETVHTISNIVKNHFEKNVDLKNASASTLPDDIKKYAFTIIRMLQTEKDFIHYRETKSAIFSTPDCEIRLNRLPENKFEYSIFSQSILMKKGTVQYPDNSNIKSAAMSILENNGFIPYIPDKEKNMKAPIKRNHI